MTGSRFKVLQKLSLVLINTVILTLRSGEIGAVLRVDKYLSTD